MYFYCWSGVTYMWVFDLRAFNSPLLFLNLFYLFVWTCRITVSWKFIFIRANVHVRGYCLSFPEDHFCILWLVLSDSQPGPFWMGGWFNVVSREIKQLSILNTQWAYNLLLSALVKSTGLRTDGRVDTRSVWINYVSSLSTPLAIPLVYPRMLAIHVLNSEVYYIE